MVRAFPEMFPKGTKKGQHKDGYWIEQPLAQNMDILCDAIVRDMQFTLLVSGNGWVRVGKSVLAQQVGHYLTHRVNEKHKKDNTFDVDNNIVFNSKELINKAFQLKPYSVLILDEGDDVTENYWSELAKDLRRFFRKCGQLNIFIIILIPDFFELPRSYAITRSVALLDVHFMGAFQRGFFNFYNFENKRQLYLKGRKFSNYKAHRYNFRGRFTNFYCIDEGKYRQKKLDDLQSDNKAEFETVDQVKYKKKVALDFLENAKNIDMDQKKQSKIIGVLVRTIQRYQSEIREKTRNELRQPTHEHKQSKGTLSNDIDDEIEQQVHTDIDKSNDNVDEE